MKISELEEMLNKAKKNYGDVEVTIQGTLLSDGYSSGDGDVFEDVFESTVETCYLRKGGDVFGDRLHIQWQK